MVIALISRLSEEPRPQGGATSALFLESLKKLHRLGGAIHECE
jgi:hypothetical protein